MSSHQIADESVVYHQLIEEGFDGVLAVDRSSEPSAVESRGICGVSVVWPEFICKNNESLSERFWYKSSIYSVRYLTISSSWSEQQ